MYGASSAESPPDSTCCWYLVCSNEQTSCQQSGWYHSSALDPGRATPPPLIGLRHLVHR